jgi:hypothetical protein
MEEQGHRPGLCRKVRVGLMAALWITLDYLDGRSLIKGPVYPDEVDLTGLLFRLNERGIATVTFSNADPLRYLYKEGEHGNTGG